MSQQLKPLPSVSGMPNGIVEEGTRFVPRLVMTPELMTVVQQVMRHWTMRERFEGLVRYGIRPLDRMLFFGPPGNGKTMACLWMARELGVPLFRINCPGLIASHMGETQRNLAEVLVFLSSRISPAICLFDEVDTIFLDRQQSRQATDRERGSALTLLLQSLDRWQAPTMLVFATNRSDQLDAALLSRIDLKLEFQGPTLDQCHQVIDYWAELLSEHGGHEWSVALRDKLSGKVPPESFRELQQLISRAAREWVANQGTQP